jgi:hypothetical protein
MPFSHLRHIQHDRWHLPLLSVFFFLYLFAFHSFICLHSQWSNESSRKTESNKKHVIYMLNLGPTRCTLFSLFLSSLALHVSGAICTHHQEHNCRVQSQVVYGFGVLFHWSRYWFGTPLQLTLWRQNFFKF